MYGWIICQINSAYIFRRSVPTLSLLIFHPDCSIYGSSAVRGRCFSGPHPVLSDIRLHRAAGVQGIWRVSLWHPPDWPLLLRRWGRHQCPWTSRSGHRVAAARFSIRTDRDKGFAGTVEGEQLLRLRLKVPGCNVTRPFSNEKRFLRKVSSNSAFLFSQEQVFFLWLGKFNL